MAIVKTNFDSGSSNLSQVATWLQTNAAEYFDAITSSGSQITCKKDEHNAFIVTNTDSSRYSIYTANGRSMTFIGGVVLFGVSTSKGLFLRSVGLANTSYYNFTDIIITKTNEDNLAFVVSGIAPDTPGSAYNHASFYAVDFNSITLVPWYESSSSPTPYCITKYLTRLDSDKTSMANVVCKNTDSFTPDVYQMCYSQYSYDIVGKFTYAGAEYYTNGCFAIAD